MPPAVPAGDQQLVQIVDAALADAARRSGHWLVCKLGCTQCCVGAFAINQLDVLRLQDGLAKLAAADPQRAARVRERALASIARLSATFPGDPVTGILDMSEDTSEDRTENLSEDTNSAAQARFDDFANDEPCPVLDPVTGACDLYTARPMTCRVFGPPVRSEDGLGVCELCYHGATDEQIAACEMEADPQDLESALIQKLENDTGRRGPTIVAFAVAL